MFLVGAPSIGVPNLGRRCGPLHEAWSQAGPREFILARNRTAAGQAIRENSIAAVNRPTDRRFAVQPVPAFVRQGTRSQSSTCQAPARVSSVSNTGAHHSDCRVGGSSSSGAEHWLDNTGSGFPSRSEASPQPSVKSRSVVAAGLTASCNSGRMPKVDVGVRYRQGTRRIGRGPVVA